jgi:glycosidase
VILDFVPNHMSDQHAYFADTVNKSRASSYFDFFARAPNGAAQHYFDWRNLENLNYANPEVQRLIVEAFLYWIREFDVDGFRVDVAWGPRKLAPEFWPRWRAELKRMRTTISSRSAITGWNRLALRYLKPLFASEAALRILDLLSGRDFVADGENFAIPLAGHETLILQTH